MLAMSPSCVNLESTVMTIRLLSSTDMIRRRNLRTRSIKMLVLDEADEMLNKGAFRKNVDSFNPFVLLNLEPKCAPGDPILYPESILCYSP